MSQTPSSFFPFSSFFPSFFFFYFLLFVGVTYALLAGGLGLGVGDLLDLVALVAAKGHVARALNQRYVTRHG